VTRPTVQIAVAGGGACGRRTARLARAVGRELGAAGAVIVCGGLGGVMEAVAGGAAETGGIVVGLLPGYARRDGNRHLTLAIPTGLGHARNVLVAAAGDALIALPGRHGTLAEVALARVLERPVIALGGWRGVRGVVHARTPRERCARPGGRGPLSARGRPCAVAASRARWRGTPIRDRDVLPTAVRLRLREEAHVVLDLGRHVAVDRESEPAERLHVERMIVGPLAAREDARQLGGLLGRKALGEHAGHAVAQLDDRLPRDVGEDERFVVDLELALDLPVDGAHDRRRRVLAELRSRSRARRSGPSRSRRRRAR
jgi:uncharacterized protein (TIGR00725 family)